MNDGDQLPEPSLLTVSPVLQDRHCAWKYDTIVPQPSEKDIPIAMDLVRRKGLAIKVDVPTALKNS